MIVDDHPMWREAVARDLTEAGFDVVAAPGEGAQALRAAGAVRPDVVVLDLQLPDITGVEVTHGILAACPQSRVLILSASGEQQDVLDAVKAGAAGYIVKSASRAEFLDAVRRTAAGDAVFSPGLAGLVLGEFRRLAASPAPDNSVAGPKVRAMFCSRSNGGTSQPLALCLEPNHREPGLPLASQAAGRTGQRNRPQSRSRTEF